MILKLALRNCIRLPARTFLILLILCAVILSCFSCALVNRAAGNAMTELKEDYVFIASLVGKGISPEDEAEISEARSVTFGDFFQCYNNADILGYNLTIDDTEAGLPNAEYLINLPTVAAFEEAPIVFTNSIGCDVVACEDLMLEREFYLGIFYLTEGRFFSRQGVSSEKTEIIIPKWVADRYDLTLGQIINVVFYNGYWPFEIVGIYDSTEKNAQMNAYTTVDGAGLMTGMHTERRAQKENNPIVRADFVLRDRDSFSSFVDHAVANGLDFGAVELKFNNAPYDKALSSLERVSFIAFLVMIVVGVTGLCLLVFFLLYFDSTRQKEKTMLYAIGMAKKKIFVMLSLEVLILFAVAVPLGLGLGRLGGELVCARVNRSVIENAGAVVYDVTEDTRTFSLPTPISASVSVKKNETGEKEARYMPYLIPGEDEVGITRYTFLDSHADQLYDALETEWTPVTFVGVSDLKDFDISPTFEELKESYEYWNYYQYCWVSENSSYKVGDKIRIFKYGLYEIHGRVPEGFSQTRATLHQAAFVVRGTYKDSELCSGTDVLVLNPTMELAISTFSLTGDMKTHLHHYDALLPRSAIREVFE